MKVAESFYEGMDRKVWTAIVGYSIELQRTDGKGSARGVG